MRLTDSSPLPDACTGSSARSAADRPSTRWQLCPPPPCYQGLASFTADIDSMSSSLPEASPRDGGTRVPEPVDAPRLGACEMGAGRRRRWPLRARRRRGVRLGRRHRLVSPPRGKPAREVSSERCHLLFPHPLDAPPADPTAEVDRPQACRLSLGRVPRASALLGPSPPASLGILCRIFGTECRRVVEGCPTVVVDSARPAAFYRRCVRTPSR